MKKFMKAIAFVTVMCMALSTVAFAAVTPELRQNEKVLDITVTGATGDEQVALMVVAAGAGNFNAPLYIDQTAANGGTAEFTAVLTNATVAAVDIYVGCASFGTNSPEMVGSVSLKKDVTNVTISNVNCTWENYKDTGMEQNATGAVLSFEFVAPEGATATQMEWKIIYEDPETKVDVPKYSGIFNISGYGLGSAIKSGTPVKLGLSFLNGSDKNDIAIAEIKNISARFLFEDGNGLRETVEAVDDSPNIN